MFILQCLSLSVSLVVIYVALKWYKFDFISNQIPRSEKGECDNESELKKFYFRNDICRFALLVVALAVDATAYFFADYNGAAYLAIMLLLCIPFVFNKK